MRDVSRSAGSAAAGARLPRRHRKLRCPSIRFAPPPGSASRSGPAPGRVCTAGSHPVDHLPEPPSGTDGSGSLPAGPVWQRASVRPGVAAGAANVRPRGGGSRRERRGSDDSFGIMALAPRMGRGRRRRLRRLPWSASPRPPEPRTASASPRFGCRPLPARVVGRSWCSSTWAWCSISIIISVGLRRPVSRLG